MVSRDRKGDPNAHMPVEVVSANKQRAALDFVLKSAFNDDAYGLTPELLSHMTVDKWADEGGMRDLREDPTWDVHDRVIGIQASVLTMLMNPTTLRRVFDNEFRVPSKDDALTLPELMDKTSAAVWSEVLDKPTKQYTARDPMVSSLRRDLQREHIERLIDLTLPATASGAASKPISNLAMSKLREIKDKIGNAIDRGGGNVDAYTKAHLSEMKVRIEKALDAQYIYNQASGSSGGYYYYGRPTEGGVSGK
jgi:hypothetical protein